MFFQHNYMCTDYVSVSSLGQVMGVTQFFQDHTDQQVFYGLIIFIHICLHYIKVAPFPHAFILSWWLLFRECKCFQAGQFSPVPQGRCQRTLIPHCLCGVLSITFLFEYLVIFKVILLHQENWFCDLIRKQIMDCQSCLWLLCSCPAQPSQQAHTYQFTQISSHQLI